MLGIIFFTIIFAVFAIRSGERVLAPLRSLAESVFEVMIRFVEAIIHLAPLAVLFLMGKLVAESDSAVFVDLGWYLITVTSALLFHFFVILPLVYLVFTRRNPYVFMQHMSAALLTAFSSASSAATLPLTMECAEKKAGIPNRIASMVLPLGATVNMDGTALYEGVAVLFIAQVLGVDLSLIQQLTVLGTALLVSIGAAGIPHAGLVMMVIILEAVGLPSEAIGIIFAVDRVVDMTRTAVKVVI
jgi:proton glutamate symport protein